MNFTVICSAVTLVISLMVSSAFGYTVIIDPSHGGKDRGIPYVFTRTSDYFMSLADLRNVSNCLKNKVFVGVYENAWSNTNAHGVETFDRSAASRLLVTAVQSALIRQARATNRCVKSCGFTVITHPPRGCHPRRERVSLQPE